MSEPDGNGHNREHDDIHGRHERHRGRQHHYKHHGREARHGGRPFDYGELRLLALDMIAEQPRHGYELMRVIEERMGGSYSPSPGVMYPTLSWLEDMGFAQVAVENGSRKRYGVTAEGEAFLTANRAVLEAMLARIGSPEGDARHEGVPAPVTRGMENLKLALRLRLRRRQLDPSAAEAIADILDAAAKAVERS